MRRPVSAASSVTVASASASSSGASRSHNRIADAPWIDTISTRNTISALTLDAKLPASAREAFNRQRASDRPDLRGGVHYIESVRHNYYVKGDVYEKVLQKAASTLRT